MSGKIIDLGGITGKARHKSVVQAMEDAAEFARSDINPNKAVVILMNDQGSEAQYKLISAGVTALEIMGLASVIQDVINQEAQGK